MSQLIDMYNPVCPHCGYRDRNIKECDVAEGKFFETSCDACGKKFLLQKQTTTVYVTEAI